MNQTFNGIEFSIKEVNGWVHVTLFPKQEHSAEAVVLAKQWCYYNMRVESIKVLRPHLKSIK